MKRMNNAINLEICLHFIHWISSIQRHQCAVILKICSSTTINLWSFALLEYYVTCSGNFLPVFRNNLLVPSYPETSERNYRYTLCDISKEHSSHALVGRSPKSLVSGANWRDTHFVCTRPAASGMTHNLLFLFCITCGVTQFIGYRPALRVIRHPSCSSFLCNTWQDIELVPFGPVSLVTNGVTNSFFFFFTGWLSHVVWLASTCDVRILKLIWINNMFCETKLYWLMPFVNKIWASSGP